MADSISSSSLPKLARKALNYVPATNDSTLANSYLIIIVAIL